MGDGGTKCIKYLIFFFNLLFFLLGITLLGFGIYAEINIAPYASVSSSFVNSSRLLIAVGCIISTVSFFGCCGAWKENKCMLIIFFVLLFIMLGLEIAAAALGYKEKDKVEENIKIDIKKAMEKYPQENKEAVDDMQKELKCCGVSGYSDWIAMKKLIPNSCKCPGSGTAYNCQMGYFKKGCSEQLKNFLQENLLVISALAITLLVIQILGMVFAMILICRIRQGTYA